MLELLAQIVRDSWLKLAVQIARLLPNLLAMLLILAAGGIVAGLVQWMLRRMSVRLDSWLHRWGVATMVDRYSGGGGAQLVARSAFWLIFGCALLMGINALNTEIGTRLVTGAFLYFPRLVTTGVVMIVGLLLGRFLARGTLIWAVNEGIGFARTLAGGVRVGVGLLTVVAAAEQLEVARTAILAAFVILLSGTVLAIALAVGLGSRKRVEQWLDQRAAFLGGDRELERMEHL
jgi:hypothetical protein